MLQVLANLVGNAMKFTPEQGTVTLGAERGARGWRFYVKDTGPGIAREHLPFVFDRFWRGDGAQDHGVGLGLAIAKGIVEAHGGEIRAESPDGGGALFTFTLPLAASVHRGH